MRALLVPCEGPIEEVELPDGDTGQLGTLQGYVGGFIEALPYPDRDDVTVYGHSEGKFVHPPNPQATRLMRPVMFEGDYIAGPLVICGFNARRGVNLDVPGDLARQLLCR